VTGRPVLALPVGPIGREEAAMAAWPRAGGRWAAVEREIADGLLLSLYYGYAAAGSWAVVGDMHRTPTDFHAQSYDRPEAFARLRVTVSVEVLDGIL